jgi:hypothetical protein
MNRREFESLVVEFTASIASGVQRFCAERGIAFNPTTFENESCTNFDTLAREFLIFGALLTTGDGDVALTEVAA